MICLRHVSIIKPGRALLGNYLVCTAVEVLYRRLTGSDWNVRNNPNFKRFKGPEEERIWSF